MDRILSSILTEKEILVSHKGQFMLQTAYVNIDYALPIYAFLYSTCPILQMHFESQLCAVLHQDNRLHCSVSLNNFPSGPL